LFQGFGQVAVVADRINDGAGNRKFARFQLRQLELPEQVLLQRLPGRVCELLLPLVIITIPGCLSGTDALFAPALVYDLDGAFLLGALRSLSLAVLRKGG